MNALQGQLARIVGSVLDSWGQSRSAVEHAGVASWVAADLPVRGAWKGTLSVFCAEPEAREMVAGIFPDAAHDEYGVLTADMLCELASIAAANLQPWLPGPTELGAPVVTQGVGNLPPPSSRPTVDLARFEGPCVVVLRGRARDLLPGPT